MCERNYFNSLELNEKLKIIKKESRDFLIYTSIGLLLIFVDVYLSGKEFVFFSNKGLLLVIFLFALYNFINLTSIERKIISKNYSTESFLTYNRYIFFYFSGYAYMAFLIIYIIAPLVMDKFIYYRDL